MAEIARLSCYRKCRQNAVAYTHLDVYKRQRSGCFNADAPDSPVAHLPANDEPALCAKMARLTSDLLQFETLPQDIVILDEQQKPLLQGDTDVYKRQL